MTEGQSRLEALGCWLSEKVADVSAHPFAQVGLILICAAWFAFALPAGQSIFQSGGIV